jgi:hypothetical protein
MGPRSGRAAGYCDGFEMPGDVNPGGRGWGYGPGGGGWGRRFGRGFDAEPDRQALRSRADALRAELRAVESRLAEREEKKETPE